MNSRNSHIGAIGFALIAMFAAVSAQSLWIDEANTAWKAAQATFQSWLNVMGVEKGSDAQMPLYMFWVWVWDKIFGHGEWALRMAGWPFLAAGIILFSWRRPLVAVVCGLSAFAWYYANEARPYAMQVGFSLALFGAAMRLLETQPAARSEFFWHIILLVSGVGLAMSHLIGMFWTAAYWAFAIFCIPSLIGRNALKKLWWLWLGAFFLLAATAGYYLWTLKAGARASGVGLTDLRNILFSFYELFGFGGLGPGRLEIRDGGSAVFKLHALSLAAYGLFLSVTLFAGMPAFFRRMGSKGATILILLMLATAFFIFGVGMVKHFRVLGRHLAPLLPVILWLLAEGVEQLWRRRGSFGKTVVTGMAVLSLCSCLEYRFAERHAKDDYRAAAAVAKAALEKGETAWWSADDKSAWYYGVPLGGCNVPPASGTAACVVNPQPAALQALPKPDWIIASKPDLYDPDGGLKNFMQTGDYKLEETFVAFKIWRKQR